MSETVTSESQAVDYSTDTVEITDKADAASAIGVRMNGGGTAGSTFWAINDRTGRGVNVFNIGWPGVNINQLSQIVVSVCELDANDKPVMGLAHMQVLNVVPQSDSTVFVRYNVAWNSNLRYRFNFIIVN